MEIISNRFFEGERPLFARKNIRLENVKFYPGESAIKECKSVEAHGCEFMGKYPFWHCNGAAIDNCRFTVYGRAAIWYSRDVEMIDCIVDAPKMFREIDGLSIRRVQMSSAGECCWNCRDISVDDFKVKGGDYIFMNCRNMQVDKLMLDGNYSFQDAVNVTVRDSDLNSKDAFWHTENVTVYNSVLNGEYLGWYSKNLRLVNCLISGTQPLCYVDGLVMENCFMKDDADLCFEYSTLQATIGSRITSIKNPAGGSITAPAIGEIIIDDNCRNPGACTINIAENS